MHPLNHHPIRLNREFRSDLAWWRLQPHGTAYISFLSPSHLLPVVEFASDASGSWGCGAWHSRQWFHSNWNSRSAPLTIMAKELIPIIVALVVWGCQWHGQRVICHCDNQAVNACIRSRTSRDKHCMHMLRTLAFTEARLAFQLTPQYINTKANHLADDLSRNNLSSFLSKVPKALADPVPIPAPLLDTWTRHSTGPLHAGSSSSALLSEWARPLNQTYIRIGHEKVRQLLHTFQCPKPIPSHWKSLMLLRGILGRRGPRCAVHKILPGRSQKCPTVIGAPRPSGAVFLPYPKMRSSGYKPCQTGSQSAEEH